MWLVGVVIRRYIDILIIIINIPYSTCIRSFFGSSILTSLFIFKCFFGLVIYIVVESSEPIYSDTILHLFVYIYNGRINCVNVSHKSML